MKKLNFVAQMYITCKTRNHNTTWICSLNLKISMKPNNYVIIQINDSMIESRIQNHINKPFNIYILVFYIKYKSTKCFALSTNSK